MAIIKVKRDYCGQEGTDVDKNVLAGSEHTVTRARAAELNAVGLVDIISDEAHTEDDIVAEEASTEPVAPALSAKTVPAPQNKAAPKAAIKKAAAAEAAQAS